MHTLLYSVPPALQQATTNPHLCQRLLDTHRQVWISLLWGPCSFFLGPGAQKSLFPQSCVSSGSSMVGLMVTSSKRAYAIPRSAAPRAPVPVAGHCWPGPPQETLRHSSVSVSVGHINDPILKTYVQLILIIHGFSFQIFLLAKAHLSPQVNTHVLLWSFTDIGSEELYFDIHVPSRD